MLCARCRMKEKRKFLTRQKKKLLENFMKNFYLAEKKEEKLRHKDKHINSPSCLKSPHSTLVPVPR